MQAGSSRLTHLCIINLNALGYYTPKGNVICLYIFTAPSGQPDNFGDLLGSMGMPPPVQPTTNGDANVEDKDKGLPCK